jgi:hypothetical protein
MAERVIHQSWGSRLGASIKGVLFGLVLFFGSFVLLWWNEGRAVRDYQTLNEVKNATVAVSSTTLQAANEGNPVHASGKAETQDELRDPLFQIAEIAIHLRRQVEMYQWEEREERETRKKMGGGTETVIRYDYAKKWSDRLIDSSRFQESGKHENPSQMPYEDWSASAEKVTLGAFTLAPELIRNLSFFEPVPPRGVELPDGAVVSGNYLFFGASAMEPAVGDTRVSFQIVPQDQISVIAKQQDSELGPWTTSTGRSYFRIQRGAHELPAMLEQAKGEIRMLTWILRLVGWLAMTMGLSLIFKPLAVLGDVIPLVGNLIGGGIGLVAAVVSAVLALITIAIAWVVVRPVIGIPLLVAAVALTIYLVRKNRAAAPAAPVTA